MSSDYETQILQIAKQLKTDSYSVCSDFFSGHNVGVIRKDLLDRYTAGEFARAGVGRGTRFQTQDSVRRDEILWLDRFAAAPSQTMIWKALADLKQGLNRQLFLGLEGFEGHYAIYPPGGFYQRHLDCFQDDDERKISLILYLNDGWKPADGGQLRIFRDGEHRDINPQGGTLVCFLSREIEHQVLESHRQRLSFAGWFKVRPQA